MPVCTYALDFVREQREFTRNANTTHQKFEGVSQCQKKEKNTHKDRDIFFYTFERNSSRQTALIFTLTTW